MNDFDNKQICSYKDIDRFGFTCDVCGRKVNGCHYINGMSFCEKCYQETFGKDNQQNEIQQLKQQLAEKDKEIAHLKEKDNYHLRYELAGADETITNLKQQLEEKDKEINSLIADYEKRISQEQELMSNMEHQLAEKDKEIEKLKTKQKPIVMHSKENYYFLEEENIKLHFAQKQLAIKELEKVKMMTEWKFNSVVDVVEYIDNQIKELKGE